MSSRARLVAIIVVLAILTVPLKFLRQVPRGGDDIDLVTAQIGQFVASVSDETPVRVRLHVIRESWSGWRFSLHGCNATAFPAPSTGVYDQRIHALFAQTGDRVSYIFRGNIFPSPPILAGFWNRMVEKLFVPFGLRPRQAYYSIALIAPETCAGRVEALPWPAVLPLIN